MVKDTLSGLTDAYDGVKTALSAVKSIYDLKLSAEHAAQLATSITTLLDTQGQLMDARLQYSALVSRVDEQEKEIMRLKEWGADKANYELKEIAVGSGAKVFVYSRKPSNDDPQPPHDLCANCYQDGIKSILQIETLMPLARVAVCHRCKSRIYVAGFKHKDHR